MPRVDTTIDGIGAGVIGAFFASTTTPKQAQIDWLTKRNGVPNLALASDDDRGGWPIGAASVVFDGPWFDFVHPEHEEAPSTLVVVARDRAGDPRDLVAWCPRDGKVATMYGRLALIGEHDLLAPQIAGPRTVHRSVMGWLRAGRRGFVVLNRLHAWRAFDGIRVAAEDVDHGLELRDLLTPPSPTIVVPQTTLRIAA